MYLLLVYFREPGWRGVGSCLSGFSVKERSSRKCQLNRGCCVCNRHCVVYISVLLIKCGEFLERDKFFVCIRERMFCFVCVFTVLLTSWRWLREWQSSPDSITTFVISYHVGRVQLELWSPYLVPKRASWVRICFSKEVICVYAAWLLTMIPNFLRVYIKSITFTYFLLSLSLYHVKKYTI